MKRWYYTKTLLIALIAILLSAPSLAGDRRKSLDQAVEEARDRYPGRVLSAETKNRGGRESHKIRILTNDGRVKRLNVDAESGRFERRSKR
ncbi:PepSY domain-containing protein [Thiosocius teredinicola]|uniref:PepSY domain-containing protein n=1 Tax=Thiosocius teredinicola TaxID=1973002 RepID=UPI000991082C